MTMQDRGFRLTDPTDQQTSYAIMAIALFGAILVCVCSIIYF